MVEKKTVRIGDDPDDREVSEGATTYSEPDLGSDMPATVVQRRDASRVSARQGRAAMNMSIAGATYEEIAEKFDYASAVVARVVVEETMAKAYPQEAAASMFQMTYARYERLLRGVFPKAEPKIPALDPDTGEVLRVNGKAVMVDNPDHIAYVKLAADIVQREAKLFGVEAPVQVQITPSTERYQEFVQMVVSRSRQDEAEEADIFAEVEDAEIVDE
jgi:hypothetical protein